MDGYGYFGKKGDHVEIPGVTETKRVKAWFLCSGISKVSDKTKHYS